MVQVNPTSRLTEGLIPSNKGQMGPGGALLEGGVPPHTMTAKKGT
jgi:hypothetical protein